MYYKVEAKCGHVGRHNYIIKEFYIYARSKKEAALIIRNTPRVKHHHKDAIRSVIEITNEEYLNGKTKEKEDYYFQVHNRQEQSKLCPDIYKEINREKEGNNYKRNSHLRRRLVDLIIKKEWENRGLLIYE